MGEPQGKARPYPDPPPARRPASTASPGGRAGEAARGAAQSQASNDGEARTGPGVPFGSRDPQGDDQETLSPVERYPSGSVLVHPPPLRNRHLGRSGGADRA